MNLFLRYASADGFLSGIPFPRFENRGYNIGRRYAATLRIRPLPGRLPIVPVIKVVPRRPHQPLHPSVRSRHTNPLRHPRADGTISGISYLQTGRCSAAKALKLCAYHRPNLRLPYPGGCIRLMSLDLSSQIRRFGNRRTHSSKSSPRHFPSFFRLSVIFCPLSPCPMPYAPCPYKFPTFSYLCKKIAYGFFKLERVVRSSGQAIRH